MPHRHSARAALLRRDRARSCGYLRGCPAGHYWLLVPEELCDRMKRIRESLRLHRDHDVLAGGAPHHYARHASLAAAPFVGASATVAALILGMGLIVP